MDERVDETLALAETAEAETVMPDAEIHTPTGPKKVWEESRVVSIVNAKTITATSKQAFLNQWVRYAAMCAFAAVLMTGVGVALLVFSGDVVLGISVIIAGAALPPLVFGVNLVTISKTAAKSPQVQRRTVQNFCFGEKITCVEQSSVCEAREVACEWTEIKTVIENKGYFFLFLNPHNAITVPKDGFITGNPDSFRAMLKDRFGASFKGKA